MLEIHAIWPLLFIMLFSPHRFCSNLSPSTKQILLIPNLCVWKKYSPCYFFSEITACLCSFVHFHSILFCDIEKHLKYQSVPKTSQCLNIKHFLHEALLCVLSEASAVIAWKRAWKQSIKISTFAVKRTSYRFVIMWVWITETKL